MDLNPMPALHSLSVSTREFLTKSNQECNDKDEGSLLERQGGGSKHDADGDTKRSRDLGGEHKASGAKNKAMDNLEDCIKSLMMSQMRESPVHVEEGIMILLRRCLASSPKGARLVLAAGNTDHYDCKKDVDVGWGCGWRNIQMLVSNIIAEDAEAREALFGGAGYVPDIPALQQWLEIAWAKDFDLPGGENFDWKIKGTNKWIGTTEGAALLRSFGVRAQIVDFQATGGKREQPGELRSKAGTEEDQSKKKDEEAKSTGEEAESKDEEAESKGEEATSKEEAGGKEEFSGRASDRDSGHASGRRRTATDNGTLDQTCIVCGEPRIQDPECPGDDEDSDICPKCMKRLQDSGNTDQENLTNEEETQITGRLREGWDNKTGGGGSEAGQITVKHQQMVEWVWRYFMTDTEESKISKSLRLSKCSPLYFQHRGHSQTIVGIERRKVSKMPDSEEVNLLVLDPSEQSNDIIESLRNNRGWEKLVKRGLQTLKQTEYQLCYAERGVAKGEELQNLKILTSKSYTY